jgi:uncharacterized protein YcbK (DUF882 family)
MEVMINKNARLSAHFTLGEMTKTSAKGIDNTPSHAAVMNLKNLCENWLEDLRYSYNTLYRLEPGEDYETSKNVKPIVINSGFRSEAVNKAIGGVKGSNHLTGCAVDIHVAGMEQAIRYACILLDIADGSQRDFDELLLERSPRGTFWLHFAVRPPSQENRRKIRFIQT